MTESFRDASAAISLYPKSIRNYTEDTMYIPEVDEEVVSYIFSLKRGVPLRTVFGYLVEDELQPDLSAIVQPDTDNYNPD